MNSNFLQEAYNIHLKNKNDNSKLIRDITKLCQELTVNLAETHNKIWNNEILKNLNNLLFIHRKHF